MATTNETGQAEYVQDVLFTDPAQLMTIEQLAEHVKNVRLTTLGQTAQENVPATESEPQAPAPAETSPRSPRRGGAFGGALKRRIEQSDTAALYAATNETDIALVAPSSIYNELYPDERGKLVHRGVLFTPREYTAITVSPQEAERRVGASVMSGTVGRPASERQARRAEVTGDDLSRRLSKARNELLLLDRDKTKLEALAKEVQSPGYAHMTLADMTGLMLHAETVVGSMLEAIAVNHGADTSRDESLKAALHYLLSNDDYRKTFSYWKEMTGIALGWTKAKAFVFRGVADRIQGEIDTRS